MQHCDLAIVGGGYAGLACARSAALAGLNVRVLDRKRDLGERIRTTGLLVKEAAELMHQPSHLVRPIPNVKLYGPDLKSVSLHSPNYNFWAVNTPDYMRWLGRRAEDAGATFQYQSNISQLQTDIKQRWILPEAELHSEFLVGADGARSNIARLLQLGQNRDFLIGAEVEMTGVSGFDSESLHVFLDKELAPGYIGWVVPGVGVTQVGLAVRKPRKPNLDKFLHKLRRLADFSNAKIVERRGGLIPCGGIVPKWHRERALLLGDSAGCVSPLTAGGIQPALELGLQTGQWIKDELNQGEPAHKKIEQIMPQFSQKIWLRRAMDHLQPENWMMNLAITNPLFQRVAQVVFYHNRGLKSTEAWRDLLLGCPEV